MDFSYEEQLRELIKLKVQKMPEHQNVSEYLESIRRCASTVASH